MGRRPRPCSKCPKYIRRDAWCPIQALRLPPDSPSCAYGRKLMNGRAHKHEDLTSTRKDNE